MESDAEIDVTVPPAPLCLECGAPACLCWVDGRLACTSARCDDHPAQQKLAGIPDVRLRMLREAVNLPSHARTDDPDQIWETVGHLLDEINRLRFAPDIPWCDHRYCADDFDVWVAEVRQRSSLWRQRNKGKWRVLVEATPEGGSGAFRFTGPRRFGVEIGPRMPYEVRVRWAAAIKACPLCGDDDLVNECDDHTPCLWLCCSTAESESEAGHLEVICSA